MSTEEQEDTTIYTVVVNHEEQYSIWPADRPLPLGWREGGRSGLKKECLEYIKEVWTDMRPLSLRKAMEAAEARGEASEAEPLVTPTEEAPYVDLVTRLSRGNHPVESMRPERSVASLRACIDRGYVFVKFTDTAGGTELGVQLDRDASDLSRADFDRGVGPVHLSGTLTLDYVKVRCIADIDLTTLTGTGHLERVE